ncbi:MAG TPA: insulinase family protein, partial [Candidatus Udaeobacter sp.]|nr:insulinase family protein [Candidatus Udaeobacter sp.]
ARRLAPLAPIASLVALLSIAGVAPQARGQTRVALGVHADTLSSVNWTLSNGMHVVAQHIPDAIGIAITVGYPGGSDQDPSARGGLAALLAELEFTSAAGDVPERARREMKSLRPLGADIHVGRCFTLFTEVANRAQFAGVLHQVVTRMRGVQVTPSVLSAAIETQRTLLRDQYLGNADVALYNEVAERAAGADDAALRRLTGLTGIEHLTVRDVAPLLAQNFSSRNAVVALTGNLEGIDLRAVLEREFASVPGGAPPPLPKARPEHAISVEVARPGVARPVGVLGVFAPAMTDSSYPAFYLASLIIGAQANVQWGDPVAPLTSRFQYSAVEDPDLVRFYPPLTLQDRTAKSVGESFGTSIGREDNLVVSDDIIAQLRFGVGWLIGGPINDQALNHIRTQSYPLILCSVGIAERELRGGEAFWGPFRARVERVGAPDLIYWLSYMRDPKLQAKLIYLPAETGPAESSRARGH